MGGTKLTPSDTFRTHHHIQQNYHIWVLCHLRPWQVAFLVGCFGLVLALWAT